MILLIMKKTIILIFLCGFLFLSCSSLALKSASGSFSAAQTFSRENDPELAAASLPSVLKALDLITASGRANEELYLAAGSSYIMYAAAFLQLPASMMGADQFEEKMLNTKRAKNLFLRGADYVLAGLGKEYRAFSEYASSPDYPALLPAVKKKDAAFLYWLAAGWMGAVSVDPFDMKLSPLKDRAKAAMDAAYRLDSNFNNGAIDEFYMAWYAAMPDFMGGSDALAKEHFNRAVEKTGGQLASVYVSYAEAVSVKNQNRAEFEQLLIQALKADSSLYPDFTLANELFKRKAAWLLKHGEDFFISEDF